MNSLAETTVAAVLIVVLLSNSVLMRPKVTTSPSLLPGKVAFYYGIPSNVNDAAGNLDAAITVFNDYDVVVLSDTLEFPQYTGAPGQMDTYGCIQNSHDDHNNTIAIIQGLHSTSVYGYISIGGENTVRVCPPTMAPEPLSITEIEARVDAWASMGVYGIFLDEAGYEIGTSRERQNVVIDYVHSKGLPVFINAWNPDDVFSPDVVGAVTYNDGPLTGTSSYPMNPLGLASHLGPTDMYLLESFQIINGKYSNDLSITWDRFDKALAYKTLFQMRIATLTTPATIDTPPDGFDQNKFDYAWWSTLLYGFDYMGYGEPNGFSALGVNADKLPFRTRPAPGNVGYTFNSQTVNHPYQSQLYTRWTNIGSIQVDAAAHAGSFSLLYKEYIVQASSGP